MWFLTASHLAGDDILSSVLGHQVCIDLFECELARLESDEQIQAATQALAARIGATVIHIFTHHYAPQGVSCIAQISASHIAIHTWPENRFASVDIFSCVARLDVAAMVALLQQTFGAARVTHTEVLRGADLASPFFRDS